MKYLILAGLIATSVACADGVDDKKFYPIVPGKQGHIERWVEKNGVYLQELPPRNLHIHPFLWKHSKLYPVEPHGVNYWYYFDRHKCLGEYVRVFDGTTECVEEHDPEEQVKNIPEPRVSLLLLIGLALAKLIARLR